MAVIILACEYCTQGAAIYHTMYHNGGMLLLHYHASYSHSQCVSQEWYRNMNSGKLIATRFGLFYYDVWDPEPTNEHSSHAISYSGSENGTNIFMQWTSPSVFYWRHLDYWWK
jgi:hypothetical protein